MSFTGGQQRCEEHFWALMSCSLFWAFFWWPILETNLAQLKVLFSCTSKTGLTLFLMLPSANLWWAGKRAPTSKQHVAFFRGSKHPKRLCDSGYMKFSALHVCYRPKRTSYNRACFHRMLLVLTCIREIYPSHMLVVQYGHILPQLRSMRKVPEQDYR